MTKVRNVWEPKQNSIRQYVGKNHLDISAGQESLLGKDTASLASVYTADEIGRRRVCHLELDASKITTAEVSLISLMYNSPVLNAIVKSDQSHDEQLVGKMLKMAAAIQSVTGSHGSYTNMGKK